MTTGSSSSSKLLDSYATRRTQRRTYSSFSNFIAFVHGDVAFNLEKLKDKHDYVNISLSDCKTSVVEIR